MVWNSLIFFRVLKKAAFGHCSSEAGKNQVKFIANRSLGVNNILPQVEGK
jgi:hypothetical protein